MADEGLTLGDAPAAPAAAAAANGNGDFLADLPDDLRSEPSLADIKDKASLAKAFVNTKRMVGSSIQLPKPDAPETEWDEKVWGKLAPKSIEDYKFGPVPDGLPADEAMDSWFKSAALESKLPPLLANRIRDRYNQFVGQLAAKNKQEEEAGRAALKSEWGSDYENRVALANRAASDDFKKLMHSVGLNAHPVVLKELAAIGASRREDGGLGTTGISTAGRTKDSIKSEIDALMATPEFSGGSGVTRQQREATAKKYQELWEEWGNAPA